MVSNQSSFFYLSSFSSYYDAKHETSRTGFPSDSRINAHSWVPRKHMSRLYPRHKQDQPITLLSRGLGPRPNLDSKPPLLSPGLSAVLRPPPSPPPISRFGKSRIHDKRATSLPYAHNQVCARDNKSVTCLEPYATTGP